jgi:hypothetical protein
MIIEEEDASDGKSAVVARPFSWLDFDQDSKADMSLLVLVPSDKDFMLQSASEKSSPTAVLDNHAGE